MKSSRIVLALAIALGTLAGCKQEEEAAPPPPPPPKPKEFVPPSDGLLAADRAARWRQADSLVRILDSVFQDSLRAQPDRQSQIQSEQDAARDIAARKAGLLGWKEYRWILDEAPRNPANSAAFQAAGLSMPTPATQESAPSKRDGKPRK